MIAARTKVRGGAGAGVLPAVGTLGPRGAARSAKLADPRGLSESRGLARRLK